MKLDDRRGEGETAVLGARHLRPLRDADGFSCGISILGLFGFDGPS